MALTREEYIDGLVAEIAQLKQDLASVRLDLLNSDAIRSYLHAATVDTAGSMARALALTEVAFYAGHELGRTTGDIATQEEGYRRWTESLKR